MNAGAIPSHVNIDLSKIDEAVKQNKTEFTIPIKVNGKDYNIIVTNPSQNAENIKQTVMKLISLMDEFKLGEKVEAKNNLQKETKSITLTQNGVVKREVSYADKDGKVTETKKKAYHSGNQKVDADTKGINLNDSTYKNQERIKSVRDILSKTFEASTPTTTETPVPSTEQKVNTTSVKTVSNDTKDELLKTLNKLQEERKELYEKFHTHQMEKYDLTFEIKQQGKKEDAKAKRIADKKQERAQWRGVEKERRLAELEEFHQKELDSLNSGKIDREQLREIQNKNLKIKKAIESLESGKDRIDDNIKEIDKEKDFNDRDVKAKLEEKLAIYEAKLQECKEAFEPFDT